MRTFGAAVLASILVVGSVGHASARTASAIWRSAPDCRAADVSLTAKALDDGTSFRLTMTNVRKQTCSVLCAPVLPQFYDRFGNRTAISDEPMTLDFLCEIVILAEGESAVADVRSSGEAARDWLRGLFDGRLAGCVRPASMDVRVDGLAPKRIAVPAGIRVCPVARWKGRYTYPARWQGPKSSTRSIDHR
jgi:hypothetical protein